MYDIFKLDIHTQINVYVKAEKELTFEQLCTRNRGLKSVHEPTVPFRIFYFRTCRNLCNWHVARGKKYLLSSAYSCFLQHILSFVMTVSFCACNDPLFISKTSVAASYSLHSPTGTN